MDRRVHLKVKIKSLAEEAKIIKQEARKLKAEAKKLDHAHGNPDLAKKLRWQVISLLDHKDFPVANEARHSLLAYAILRGKPYCVAEQKCREDNRPSFKKVEEMARRFGATKEEISDWIDEAKKHLGIYVAPKPQVIEKTGIVKTGIRAKVTNWIRT